MKHFLWVGFLLSLLWGALPRQAMAAEARSNRQEGGCQSLEYLIQQSDCFSAAATVSEAESAFPSTPFPASQPEPALSELPYYYLRVTRENAPLFTSLEAAVAGEPVYRTLETGFDYVTYIDYAEVDEKSYYMIAPGIWMQRQGISPVATPTFQGLELYDTPQTDFGWVLFSVESKATPGLRGEDYTGQVYNRYEILQIYDVKEASGMEWYQIGPDEWIEGRQIARVTPNTNPPEGVDGDRWIEVNLKEQTLTVYDQRELVFAALVSTGVPGAWTQPGLFQIYLAKETEIMSGAFTADRSDYYYLEDVPWTLYFDQSRALHGAYWHNGYGVPRSRGCVNLSPGDAHWIFNWAEEGDWVYVWDPSEETPTDPGLYGAGGA